jgi:hypothetical protein
MQNIHPNRLALASPALLTLCGLLILCGLLSACGETAPADRHLAHAHHVVTLRAAPGASLPEQVVRLDATDADGVVQVGLYIDGDAAPLMFRALERDLRRATWTEWAPVELTWSEPPLHVGRLLLSRPAERVELRGVGGLQALSAELFEEIRAPLDRPLARDLPVIGGGPLGVLRQRLMPDDMVISRADWGARDPGRICGDVVAPYRMSVHHTASPDSDGADPAARMRQMQAYHMDNQGWCDIGYHFVVSQSGLIYQGRSDERRPGAHVGGENSGNIGFSLIGNYEAQQVPAAQFQALARGLRWASDTYGIPLERSAVKGHQEWPAQATNCPGRNMLNRLDEALALAREGGGLGPEPEPDPDPDPDPEPGGALDVALTAAFDSAPVDLPATRPGVGDLLPGERATWSVVLRNGTTDPLRGVTLDFSVGGGLKVVRYGIDTDHPALDGASWMRNDAHDAPENPPHDAPGEAATLTLYAFAAGESKRVTFEVEAEGRSPDARPALTAFVRHIDGVHDQAEWGAAPSLTRAAAPLDVESELDVQSRAGWLFESAATQGTEGWRPCVGTAAPSVAAGALQIELATAADCVLSPAWTRIDADAWPQVVLDMGTPEGGAAILSWTGDSGRHAVEFDATAPGRFVLDLSDHTGWTGEVHGLVLSPRVGAGPQGIATLDALTLQSERDVAPTGADRVAASPTPWRSADAPDVGSMEPAAEAPDRDGDGPSGTGSTAGGPTDLARDGGGGGGGCDVGRGAAPVTLLLLGLPLLALRRRRQRA